MVFADLHMHTNYSDGIYEPEVVLGKAKEKGISCVSIADHDTYFHQELIQRLSKKIGIRVIPGIELSCYNYDVLKKVHIVALYLPKKIPNIEPLINRALHGRDLYHRELIKNFQDIGYNITYEDAKKYSSHNIVFKMNIFSAIKEKYSEVDEEFYKEHFQGRTPKEVEERMEYIDVKEGIQAILSDNGIPILAHPSLYDSFPELEEYINYGLKGIEISHHSMSESDVDMAKKAATKYSLLCSGGSDYHRDRYTKKGIEHLGSFGLDKHQFEQIDETYQGVILNK